MIRLLEESEGNILGFQMSEKLTEADYKTVLTPAISQAVEHHGSVRTLLYFDDTFAGWEAKALWEDAKYIRHVGDFDKIAIVGGPAWVSWMANVFRPFFKGEMKTFQGTEIADAWAWIK